jgi:hypothetical protein
MDDMILSKAKAEMDAELRKKEALKTKTLAAKADRDRILKEVQVKRDLDERAQR